MMIQKSEQSFIGWAKRGQAKLVKGVRGTSAGWNYAEIRISGLPVCGEAVGGSPGTGTLDLL